mmetsp:Transcript_33762/g.90122  ORF Transcript_33762/g.90122 Transcript_33762/m.90122 type:complete len:203 (+) Transcript_33762:1156-1764(+)
MILVRGRRIVVRAPRRYRACCHRDLWLSSLHTGLLQRGSRMFVVRGRRALVRNQMLPVRPPGCRHLVRYRRSKSDGHRMGNCRRRSPRAAKRRSGNNLLRHGRCSRGCAGVMSWNPSCTAHLLPCCYPTDAGGNDWYSLTLLGMRGNGATRNHWQHDNVISPAGDGVIDTESVGQHWSRTHTSTDRVGSESVHDKSAAIATS